MFGHCVRGPLDVIRECWEEETPNLDLLTYVTELGGKLSKAWDSAKTHLEKCQKNMKKVYDKHVKDREFEVGEQVLVLLPMPGNPLKAKYSGPWKVANKVSNLNNSDKEKEISKMSHQYVKTIYKEEFTRNGNT